MQLSSLEGIHDLVADVAQLASGNTKFCNGVGRVGKCGVGVQVLEEVGKFGSVVKLLAGVQGDTYQQGLFYFHILGWSLSLLSLWVL